MGNSLPLPCVCHCRHGHDDEASEFEGTAPVAGGGAKKRRRRKLLQMRPDCSRNVRAARPRHVVPVVDDDTPEDSDGGGWNREQEAAWPECRVERAGHGEDGGVRVRIVMKRKDIAQLVARLEQRGAEERNAAGMEDEVRSTELSGCNNGNDGGGGGVAMSPCRDAWRPRLSIIPEHY